MRLVIWILVLMLTAAVVPAQAADGLVMRESQHTVERTMNRLERSVRVAGFRVFARIDHSRAADRVNIRMRPTQLLIFGKPQAGSLLMLQGQSIGIDLPLKYLVWLDEANRVQIGWNAPDYLAKRHAIDGADAVLAKMGQALERIAEAAARR